MKLLLLYNNYCQEHTTKNDVPRAGANAEHEVLARAMDAKAAIMAEKRNMLDNEKIVFIASALCF